MQCNLVPGDTLLYTIVMQNQSGYIVNGIEFVDSIPANTTYVAASVSAPPGSTVVSETPTLDITGINVPAHGQISFSFRVRVNDPLPAGVTQISNQGVVNYDSDGDGVNDSSQQTDGDSILSGNQPTIIAVTAGANFGESSKSVALHVDQGSDGFVSPGDTLRYTVLLPNTGDQNSTTLTFTDPLPAETTYLLKTAAGSALPLFVYMVLFRLNHFQLFPHRSECFQSLVQVLLAVGCRDHDANASFALGNSGESKRHGEYIFFKEIAAELLRERGFTQHDRRDGGGADAGIKTHFLHPGFEIFRIVP